MLVVCAWCRVTIAGDDRPTAPDLKPGAVSHGICPACYAEQERVLAAMGPAADHSTVTDADVGGEGG